MPSWTAECAVDEALARTLIESQFPEFKGARIALLGVGWDNTAYRVTMEDQEKAFVFRFPRREVAVSLLAIECDVLPRIADRVSVPIPVPTHRAEASADYPWPFAGYTMLPGQTACALDLSDSQRAALAQPLGLFLRSLHSIDTAPLRELPDDQFGKLDLDKRLPMIREFLSAHPDLPGRKKLADFCGHLERTRPTDQTRCLTHGDFYVRHLLLDVNRNLCGVIDWGDVALNSPATDLSIAYTFLPEAARPEFLNAYGDVPQGTLDLARMRAITYGCILMDYGKQVGELALEREARRALLV